MDYGKILINQTKETLKKDFFESKNIHSLEEIFLELTGKELRDKEV